MSSPRLSIRVDVDVEHARQVLEAQLASVGADLDVVTPGRVALANMVRLLRERLQRDIAAAYPEARVVVTMWRKEPKARATKVRIGHRTADPLVERRCALIAEHVDALRAVTVETVRREVAAAPLAPLKGSTLPDDLSAIASVLLPPADAGDAGPAIAGEPPPLS
jgi:hypothetical protein